MLILLFDHAYHLLGGIHTTSGALEGRAFVRGGDDVLEMYRAYWEMKGILLRHELVIDHEDGVKEYMRGDELIPTSDPRFFQALHDWAIMRGYTAIDLEKTHIPRLKDVLHLPLTKEERYAFISALAATSDEERKQWEDVMLAVKG